MALIMVMTAIVILMAMWGDFTFESKISRIKTTNMLDKTQSRMMAETALELAMVRLRLYKEAYNTKASNANGAQVPAQLLNQLWEIPFAFPIPMGKDSSAVVKAAVAAFQKETLLEGEMRVSIQNISNKLNLNMIRSSLLKSSTTVPQAGATAGAVAGVQGGIQGGGGGVGYNPNDLNGDGIPDNQENLDPNFSMETQLLKHLQKRIREKGDEDEEFRGRHGNADAILLVATLKYYISDKNPRRQNVTQVDMQMDNAESMFNELKITPKYGPLSSMSELYLLPGWDDEIVDLISAEFDVFPTVMIDLNKLTASLLQMLIPNINENEVKEFFQWRDNPDKPQYFNSLQDFKNYMTVTASILSSASFDQLFEKYQLQGIHFGTSPSLFRVLAEGVSNSSTTNIVATVALPSASAPTTAGTTTAGTTTAGTTTTGTTTAGTTTNGTTSAGTTTAGTTGGATSGNQNAQTLMDPRIIDIQIN